MVFNRHIEGKEDGKQEGGGLCEGALGMARHFQRLRPCELLPVAGDEKKQEISHLWESLLA